MKEPKYSQPLVRNIVIGILVTIIFFMLFGYLADIIKWAGAALLFLPARVGLVRQVSQAEVVSVDFTTSPSQVFFPTAGQYAFYTSNHDLLVITDALIEADSTPWLVVSSSRAERLPVSFITRGLMPYDTPLASGRPIYSLYIPSPGIYTVTHPTRPLVTTYFVRDYVSGQESLYKNVLILEIIILVAIIIFFAYRRRFMVERAFSAARKEKREQVEAFWKERRQKVEKKDGTEKTGRWDDL